MKGRVIRTLVLGYLLPLVSQAVPYLASLFFGTFPLVLRTNIGKSNSGATNSRKKEVPSDASMFESACAARVLK